MTNEMLSQGLGSEESARSEMADVMGETSTSHLEQPQMVKSNVWFAWIEGSKGPQAQLWIGGIPTVDQKPIKSIWSRQLDVLEPMDLLELIQKYPVDKVLAPPPKPPKSNVTLIDCTGMHSNITDRAINILLFTKNTRLNMVPDLMQEISDWPQEKKMQELEYMANTIPSSWEFIDYTFLITGVTRGFTHQLVRTRAASYAQQTMRVLDVTGWDYGTGPTIEDSAKASSIYHGVMGQIAQGYKALIKSGAAIEDARGILPTNILTNIAVKMDMRCLVDLTRKRSSSRTQGEYRTVLEQMKAAALEVHPWLSLFINRTYDQAIVELEQMIIDVNSNPVNRTKMIKLLDQLRSKQ